MAGRGGEVNFIKIGFFPSTLNAIRTPSSRDHTQKCPPQNDRR
jgi:hypothetical protein